MKKIIVLLFILSITFATTCFAGSRYDYRTGNYYNWNSTPGGNTHVNGFNSRTGNSWNTTIQSNGNQHGYDSKGNYWNYNKSSGTYYNYGTGEMRQHGKRIQ